MTQRHIPVSIGSNVKPLAASPAATAGLVAPARVAPPAYKLADALGVGLFKALRFGDKAYQVGLPMFMNALASGPAEVEEEEDILIMPHIGNVTHPMWDFYYGDNKR